PAPACGGAEGAVQGGDHTRARGVRQCHLRAVREHVPGRRVDLDQLDALLQRLPAGLQEQVPVDRGQRQQTGAGVETEPVPLPAAQRAPVGLRPFVHRHPVARDGQPGGRPHRAHPGADHRNPCHARDLIRRPRPGPSRPPVPGRRGPVRRRDPRTPGCTGEYPYSAAQTSSCADGRRPAWTAQWRPRSGGAAPAPATRGAGTETALVPLLPPTDVGGSEARGNPRDDRTGVPTGERTGEQGRRRTDGGPRGTRPPADRRLRSPRAAHPEPLTRPWSSRDSAACTSSRDRSAWNDFQSSAATRTIPTSAAAVSGTSISSLSSPRSTPSRSTPSTTATACWRTTISVDCHARLVRHSSATYSCVKAG